MNPPRRHLPLAVAIACLATYVASVAGASAAAPHVSLSVRAKPPGSDRVLATGRVMPAPRIARVEVQVKGPRGWGRFVSGRLSHGAFKLSHPATGTLTLRARVFQGKRPLGVSAVRKLSVKGAPKGGPGQGGGATGGGNGSTSGGGHGTGALPSPAPEDPLGAASLMATIESYSRLPNHLSATANSFAAEDEFQANLAAAGLRLGEQAFEFPRFAVEAVGLTAGSTPVPAAAIAPLLYSGTTPGGGVTAPLFDGGSGGFEAGEAAGKIVVVSIPYEHNSKAVGLYPAIEKAVVGGAKGLVAVTQAVGDFPKWEDVNARNGTGPLPVLMVGKRSGEAVIEAAAGGENGTLTLAADTSGVSCDRDVWGELEGADPNRRVFVGTPISSFTPSASEHGSGIEAEA